MKRFVLLSLVLLAVLSWIPVSIASGGGPANLEASAKLDDAQSP